MAVKLIDYALNGGTVSNPDGSLPIAFSGVTAVPGPGATAAGQFDTAIDLNGAGKGMVALTALTLNRSQFCVRVVLQANAWSSSRQNVVESDVLPFSIHLGPAEAAGALQLFATVGTVAYGWRGPSTQFVTPLKPAVWYAIDLIYDCDTVGLQVDGEMIAVHAFPNGALLQLSGRSLYLGTWIDGQRDHFNGRLAGLQLFDGIPEALEARLDEGRRRPQWFITHKYEGLKDRVDLGGPTAGGSYDALTSAFIQPFERGTISYLDSFGTAFEIHGELDRLYRAVGTQKLGCLAGDVVPSLRPGGVKSIFTKGAIYWSPDTGAQAVTGRIYLAFEGLGEAKKLGFPTKPEAAVPGGLEQEFQTGRIYYKNGAPRACEVHGGILARFLELGGVASIGFPRSDEAPIKRGNTVIGAMSEFERGSIYWSARTGAHDVRDPIRRHYEAQIQGPLGRLGLPISGSGPIPGTGPNCSQSCFQEGAILDFGPGEGLIVVDPFKLFLGRISTKESEGLTMGENDLYMRVSIAVDGRMEFQRRYPKDGSYSEANDKDIGAQLPALVRPNTPGTVVDFRVDVWEADSFLGGKDERLGDYRKRLDITNAWGLRERRDGVFNSGSFSKVKNISWAVQAAVDPARLATGDWWWGVANRGTPKLSQQTYAEAFSDVDSEPDYWEPWDWDALEALFYQGVVEGICSGGNCFGMSTEGLYVRKARSLFTPPLRRFTWPSIEREVNIRHCYQVGADAIWWFVGQFLSGNTHDPKDVFRNVKEGLTSGNDPVLCLTQNYAFTGAPHALLPYQCDDSTKPWTVHLFDPNFPSASRNLSVDPDNNTFSYRGGSSYSGGAWTGGRLFYYPWSLLNSSPRTPIWDAILLLLGGLVVILAGDAETAALTDADGNDLDGLGARAAAELKAGRPIYDCFVPYKGVSVPPPRPRVGKRPPVHPGSATAGGRLPRGGQRPPTHVVPILPKPRGPVAGELLFRMAPSPTFRPGGTQLGPRAVGRQPLGDLQRDPRMRLLAEELRKDATSVRLLGRRSAHHVAADRDTMSKLSEELKGMVAEIASRAARKDFTHTLRGRENGTFDWNLRGDLSSILLSSPSSRAEKHQLGVSGLGSGDTRISLRDDRARVVRLDVVNRLGVGPDRLKISLENVPVDANKGAEFVLAPGLAGAEVVTKGGGGTGKITVVFRSGGKDFIKKYDVPWGDGVRIKPTSIQADGRLAVSRIDQVFGPALKSERLKPLS